MLIIWVVSAKKFHNALSNTVDNCYILCHSSINEI